MIQKANSFLIQLDSYMGGHWWFVFLLLGTGIFFTVYLGFPQIRYFKHALNIVKGKFDKKTDEAIVDIEGLPTNSILFFNNDNWGGFPETKKRQPVLAKAMIEKGMKVVKTELKHEDIPEEFFTEYMNK